jgi:hypothetical protein
MLGSPSLGFAEIQVLGVYVYCELSLFGFERSTLFCAWKSAQRLSVFLLVASHVNFGAAAGDYKKDL